MADDFDRRYFHYLENTRDIARQSLIIGREEIWEVLMAIMG